MVILSFPIRLAKLKKIYINIISNYGNSIGEFVLFVNFEGTHKNIYLQYSFIKKQICL